MDTFILPLLMAGPAGAEGNPADAWTAFIPFVAVILIFYLLIIRPQSKKRKETEKMIAALKKGDRIVTIGGLYGTIQSIKETTVIVKADDNVKLEFLRSAISSVIAPSKEEKEDTSESSSGE
ncbi:MAG: preprotein translocase subunit YajC [Treponema sp.]|nr:preprotein translocase subunit YajC [Treponema sp.]